MKKIFFCIVMVAIASTAMGQAKPTKVAEKKSTTKVEKVDAKTFKAVKSSSSRGTGYQPTGYSYIDTDGKTYEIYSHVVTRGQYAGQTCYYITKSNNKKTGKPNWKKIDVKL